MKLQKLIIAIIASFIFAASANAQFGGLLDKAKEKVGKVKQEVEKVKQTKQELEQLAGKGNKNTPAAQSQTNGNANSWITFSKSHTQFNEARNGSLNTLGCGDGVFATVNYRQPVDNSGGYTVSMLVDGAVVAKQQMSGGSETSVNQTIHIELIASEDADDNYPKVSFAKAGTILRKLTPTGHAIQIVVSLNANPKNIAVGEFEYTGGAGCDAKKPRNQNNQKDTTKTNSQNQQVESQKPVMVELELQGSCGDSARLVTIENSVYDRRAVYVKNGNSREQAVVGAKIFLKADFGTDTTLIYTVGSDSFQVVKVCQ